MIKKCIGVFIAALLLVSVFAGCGSSSKSRGSTASMSHQTGAVSAAADQANFKFSEDTEMGGAGVNGQHGDAAAVSGAPESPAEQNPEDDALTNENMANADSLAGAGNTIDDTTNAILAERKIIRSASLTIEVENFDEAVDMINSIILGIGIIQESNISTDRVYVEDQLKLVKKGTIVLRVNKDKFDSVINNLTGIGDVYNQSINGQDVTDKYVDTESRLRLLRLEQDKLEAYLVKLSDLDQIFKTESRLTDIRQEIESLTGNLNKMSSLVELSTITLTMNEKYPGSDKKPVPVTYGQKLLNNLKSSLESVVTFLGELLIVIVAAIPILILLGLLVLLGLFIYRRIPKKRYTPAPAAPTVTAAASSVPSTQAVPADSTAPKAPAERKEE